MDTGQALKIILICLLCFGCKEKLSEGSKKAAQEGRKNREVKKLSEAEIFTKGLETGRVITEVSQKLIVSHLKNSIETEGVQGAIKYCNIRAFPLTDSISRVHHTNVKRTSLRLRNPKNSPDSVERLLLEAYAYNVENGVELKDNIQNINENELLYTRPIQIRDPMCLKCHGIVGKEIDSDTRNLLLSHYPDDNAIGYQITDLRGMWSIRLQVKDIVNSIEQ